MPRAIDAVLIPNGECFTPTDAAGSPWSPDLVHGGPPAGLLARAIERFVPELDMRVARLTVDLFRPVPRSDLSVSARTVRAGNRIHVVEASLLAGDVEVSRATGLLLRATETDVPPSLDSTAPPPGPDGLHTTSLSGSRADGGLPRGFHTTVEARWVSRPGDPGPSTAWLRLPLPFIAGEETSPLVQIAALADFVNAVGSRGALMQSPFINADSTIYLHRYPEGEWIGLQVDRRLEPYGLGVAEALLFDRRGAVGRAVQAVLANRRP